MEYKYVLVPVQVRASQYRYYLFDIRPFSFVPLDKGSQKMKMVCEGGDGGGGGFFTNPFSLFAKNTLRKYGRYR